MSVEAVDAVLRGVFGVDPSAKLALIVIAEHCKQGNGGIAWPSVPTIALLACMSERNVRFIVHDMIAAGWLSIEQASRGGRGRTTVYRLNLPRMIAVAAAAKAAKAKARNPEAQFTVRTGKTVKPSSGFTPAETLKSGTRNPEIGERNPEMGGPKTLKPSSGEPVLEPEINRTGVEPARAREGSDQQGPTSTPVRKKLNGEPEEPRASPAPRPRMETEGERLARHEREKAWTRAVVEATAAGLPIPPKPTGTSQ